MTNKYFLVANSHSSNSSSWSVSLVVGLSLCPQMCENIFNKANKGFKTTKKTHIYSPIEVF